MVYILYDYWKYLVEEYKVTRFMLGKQVELKTCVREPEKKGAKTTIGFKTTQ
jgi:hypothetical protein